MSGRARTVGLVAAAVVVAAGMAAVAWQVGVKPARRPAAVAVDAAPRAAGAAARGARPRPHAWPEDDREAAPGERPVAGRRLGGAPVAPVAPVPPADPEGERARLQAAIEQLDGEGAELAEEARAALAARRPNAASLKGRIAKMAAKRDALVRQLEAAGGSAPPPPALPAPRAPGTSPAP